ncbi:MAG TPA: hypothetical protein VEC37_16615, partial [Bacillota bacterium]|nr:hypothetical protein [Bacillota bacterium]
MNLQLNHFKYRHQLIVFGLILGILPVLFLGILSYSTSSTIVQKKVNKTNLQILQQNELRVEEVLKSIQYYYLVLANSSTITKYLNVNLTYRDQDQVKELRQCLMGMQVAQPVLKNVYYINFSHNWVLVGSGEKPVTKQYDFHNLTAIIKDQRSFFWVCSPKEQDIIGYNRKTSSKPVDGINLIIKLPLNSNIPQGALIVNLQGSEFAKALIQKDRLDEMFLFDERGELILRDGKTRFTAAQIAAVSRAIKGKPENQGFYETHLAQRKVSISFRKSEYNGWIYVSVYDVSDITQDSRRIGWATLIICVIMILGVALVTFFGSTIFYTPIKNIFALLEKKTDIQVQDVQKEDNEFAYIEEGIATLITQRAEMNKQIQAQMFRLEELLLIKLVTGTFNRNNLDSKPEILGWVSSWKLMSIMAIQIDSCDNVKFVQNDREQLLLAVSDDVCNLIKKNCRLTPQIINKFLIVLVGTQDEDRPRFANYVQNCAGMIKNQVKEHLGIGVSIGIGRPFQDFYETPL